ncbi:PAAR-like domain-containing protein [Pantoea agglomerans]|uniref:PAAR-like domain-containing protein n=1 Tax=Enterobacter agglomerans TaxID=549 RepID=UPI00301D399F
MADNYAARKDGVYKVVGLAPDLCFTPGIQPPVPYPVTATLAPSKSTIDSVRFNGHAAFVYKISYVPTTIGDAAGRNKGVVSGTVEGDCWSIEHSPDTYIGGFPLNRVQDMFAMNGKAIGGRGGNLTKKETWERRKALIEKGKNSKDPKAVQAALRLEQNNTGMEKARLADYVYEPRDPTRPMPDIPEGWKDISDDPEALAKYNLTPKSLRIAKEPGFRARVYEPDEAVFGKDMSASVVFRGTRMTETVDWKNNLQQGIGVDSNYYKQAVSIGTSVRRSSAPIDMTGHSLGGGMASSASRASGKTGWTFNSAGLKSSTVKKYSGEAPVSEAVENISAYRVKGEVLTMIQEPGFWAGAAVIGGLGLTGLKTLGPWGAVAFSAVGVGLVMSPSAVGNKHPMDGGEGSAIDMHGMDQVKHCIELEKDNDEKLLSSF